VLDGTASSVKQSIYEARTGLLHAREGREMPCDDVRRALSDGDGRVLRGTRMRAHLRSCSGCRRFQQELVRRPRELAMLAPPLPVAAGAALVAQLLPASGAATAGMLTASSAAGTMAAITPKIVATVTVIAAAAGGAAAVRHGTPTPPPPRQSQVRPAAVTAPPPASSPVAVTKTPVARGPRLPVPAAPKSAKARKPAKKSKTRAHGRSPGRARAAGPPTSRGRSQAPAKAAPANGRGTRNPRAATPAARGKNRGSNARGKGGG
jgi:hypothetical protein